MGFWGSLGSFVSGAVSVIGSAIGSVAGSIGSLAQNTLKVAAGWLGPIATVVSAVATLLGVFNKEDDVEELGAKAMQPEAKKPEEFDTNAEYIDHLRNEVELDKEKFEKAGPTEQLARKAIGTGIAMKGINEEKGFETPIETWMALGKLGLDETKVKEIDALLDAFKDGKLEDFAKYVDGKLEGIEKNEEISGILSETYKKLEPEAPIEDIEQKVMDTQVGDIEPKDLSK
jgi:hypothetical protein